MPATPGKDTDLRDLDELVKKTIRGSHGDADLMLGGGLHDSATDDSADAADALEDDGDVIDSTASDDDADPGRTDTDAAPADTDTTPPNTDAAPGGTDTAPPNKVTAPQIPVEAGPAEASAEVAPPAAPEPVADAAAPEPTASEPATPEPAAPTPEPATSIPAAPQPAEPSAPSEAPGDKAEPTGPGAAVPADAPAEAEPAGRRPFAGATRGDIVAVVVCLVGLALVGLLWVTDPLQGWFYPAHNRPSPRWLYPSIGITWTLICWITGGMGHRAVERDELTLRAALTEILHDNWAWRDQAWHLAVTDLQKEARDAVLGWAWLIIKPATYIAVFWFALEIGLRSVKPSGDYPYILWLSVGMVAWYFMSDLLNAGMGVYRRYPYLVNRVRFPISVISTFYAMSSFMVYLMSMAMVFVFMLIFRVPFSVYLLQLPVLTLVMFVFFTFWSILMAPLATLSKDFGNLMKSLTTPMFWLSGVLFSVANVKSRVVQTILHFNPITFFATSVRATICDKFWIWQNASLLLPFLLVLALVIVLALRTYARLSREVADVL